MPLTDIDGILGTHSRVYVNDDQTYSLIDAQWITRKSTLKERMEKLKDECKTFLAIHANDGTRSSIVIKKKDIFTLGTNVQIAIVKINTTKRVTGKQFIVQSRPYGEVFKKIIVHIKILIFL